MQYLVDDNEGCGIVVSFVLDGGVALACCDDPCRPLEVASAIRAAPDEVAAVLDELRKLPFFSSFDRRFTAMFWSTDGSLESAEPWYRTYAFGGEILSNELMDDDDWRVEGGEYYGVDSFATNAMCEIADRVRPGFPTTLCEAEVELIAPRSANYRDEAIQDLVSGGVFSTEGIE